MIEPSDKEYGAPTVRADHRAVREVDTRDDLWTEVVKARAEILRWHQPSLTSEDARGMAAQELGEIRCSLSRLRIRHPRLTN